MTIQQKSLDIIQAFLVERVYFYFTALRNIIVPAAAREIIPPAAARKR